MEKEGIQMNLTIDQIELRPEGVFALNAEAKLEVYGAGQSTGRWTLNQIRAHQGLGPLPYGDQLTTDQAPKTIQRNKQ
jgi:hypothetical protein